MVNLNIQLKVQNFGRFLSNLNIQLKVQNFGRFLSNMVMPNIGAFIAWGFITAIFLYDANDPQGGGWFPNQDVATAFINPMITFLLPLLIGYTGGKLIYGERGGVVGAINTMGMIVGSSIPMFLGAMIAGPLGGLCIKLFDKAIDGKIKSGFEMLVNNFSAGIIGMLLALFSYFIIGPCVFYASEGLAKDVKYLIEFNLLPITSITIEPAKILFLNNAINHGIFTPLGVAESAQTGKSIVFMLEANPGPGLGLLLAYLFFGKGNAKGSAGSAAIIHFFGGIHEIYFPYVLMNPRLIIAVILGGMAGIFTLTLFDAGLTAPASPGSIFAIMGMAKGSYLGITLSVIAATVVSFVASAILLKTAHDTDSRFEEAKSNVTALKNQSNNLQPKILDYAKIKKIIVACDAGMGSSAMGASVLRKKIEEAHFNIEVSNMAINNLPSDVDIVITHKNLTQRAKQFAPNADHISLSNFLDTKLYTDLVEKLLAATSAKDLTKPSSRVSNKSTQNNLFKLSANNIFLDLKANNKDEAIRFVGQKLVDNGYVEAPYIDAMFAREKLTSTYLGEFIAIPHGTIAAKENVKHTGIVFCQFPSGIKWTDDENDQAKIVIGIAACNDEHLEVIAKLTTALDQEGMIDKLITSKNIDDILVILG